MTKPILPMSLILAALVGLTACGGNSSSLFIANGTSQGRSADSSAVPAWDLPEATRWAAMLGDPGRPGVDYDPAQITVYYRPGASLPGGLVAAAPADPAARAGAQDNAVLRENKQYEPLTDAIAARYGLRISQQVYWGGVNMASFTLPDGMDGKAVIERVRQEWAASVQYAGFSHLYGHCLAVNDPDFASSTATYGPQWGHRRINCASAWDYTTGDPSVRIAVVDTGVRITHEELTAQVLDPQVEFPSSNLDVVNHDNTVEDLDGHGTFIAGLIAAQANNSRTLAGAAFDCEVMPVKITNGAAATDATILSGCSLAYQLGAKVINLSFGDTHDDPYLQQMVDQIVQGGRMFVGAAGNNGSSTPEYPGGYPNSLCVGASDNADRRSSFSNYGNWVDITAPGEYLKSTTRNADNSYNDWTSGDGSGTSFSAPLVAAAAGLIWSFNPAATVSDVREYLVTTGAPTTGFGSSAIKRLDIAAAFVALNTLRCRAPQPGHLVQHGSFGLTASVSVAPDSVDAYLNSDLVGTKTSAPFSFTFDSTAITFGRASATFTAKRAAETSTDSVDLIVDNTAGVFPLAEDFETGGEHFKAIDPKDYALSMLQELKQYTDSEAHWTQNDVSSNGPALWSPSNSGGYESQYCMRLGTPGNTYGSYEIDALVSQRIDLTNVTNPTLTFYQHYNMQDGGQQRDRGYVLVSSNYGQTFSLAALRSGGDALFSGYEPGYTLAEVDLSQFAGKQVHVALVFESDGSVAGEQAGAAGWWVDHLVVAANYATDLPSISGVTVPANSVYGTVPGKTQMSVGVKSPVNIARVRYIFDVAPLGTITVPPDVIVTTSTAPFTEVLTLPSVPNQLATMHVQCWDSGNVPAPEVQVPVYLFNLGGDANADSVVNQLDTDLIGAKLGLTNVDAGYSPFCDSNCDNVINELDGALVGYNWGNAL